MDVILDTINAKRLLTKTVLLNTLINLLEEIMEDLN